MVVIDVELKTLFINNASKASCLLGLSMNSYHFTYSFFSYVQLQLLCRTNATQSIRVISLLLDLDLELTKELCDIDLSEYVYELAVKSVPFPAMDPFMNKDNRDAFLRTLIELSKRDEHH